MAFHFHVFTTMHGQTHIKFTSSVGTSYTLQLQVCAEWNGGHLPSVIQKE